MTYLPTYQHKLKKTLATTVLVLSILTPAIALVNPLITHAQEVRTMTVIPPTISVNVDPGSYTEGTMKIVNDSSEPLTFTVITQDFVVDNTQGVPNILPPDTLSNKYSAAAWIGLDAQKVTVPPRTRQELSYYVQVPIDARPGGHYAAVVFNPDATGGEDQASGAKVEAQIGTLFLVNVKGTITERAEVSRFTTKGFYEYGPATIDTQIKNLGDLHITPKGFITVSNMFGKQAYTVPLEERNIFPGAGRDFETSFGKKLMIGRYKATFTATFGQNNNLPLTATVYFWVFPWKVATVVIVLVIIAILGTIYLKKRKNQTPPQTQVQEPTQPIS